MNKKINRITWKCRRGMREIDLLLREFSNTTLSTLDEYSTDTFNQVLDYDDQKLFDYIFKNESYIHHFSTIVFKSCYIKHKKL